jgi:hypothetical protein
MTPAEECKKRQKKENYQYVEQELFSTSSSASNDKSAPDKIYSGGHKRGARDKGARVRKKSARECASFPRFQLVCVTQPHCSRARPPLSMYATRISEPAGAINEEEIRLTFSSVSKAQRKQQGGFVTLRGLAIYIKKKSL